MLPTCPIFNISNMAPEYSQSTLAVMSLTTFCLIVWYRSRGPPVSIVFTSGTRFVSTRVTQLDHIPSMGPTAPVAAYISAIHFLFNAPAVVQKGYERVSPPLSNNKLHAKGVGSSIKGPCLKYQGSTTGKSWLVDTNPLKTSARLQTMSFHSTGPSVR